VSMTGDDTHKEDDMTKQPLVPLRQVVLKWGQPMGQTNGCTSPNHRWQFW
jgi:hypothetical protein